MQTTHTHTQGPWHIHGNGIYSGDIYLAACYAPTANGIRPLNDESSANARLIAAAPDLLAALKSLDSTLTALLCERILDSTLPEFYTVRDARDAARAAIAKATGQS